MVRLAPDELSYVDGRAWRDIYGHRQQGEVPKDPNFYLNTSVGDLGIIGADTKRHGNLRRLISHGFSDRALKEQRPIVQHCVDLLMARLRALGEKKESIDMVKWYNVSGD